MGKLKETYEKFDKNVSKITNNKIFRMFEYLAFFSLVLFVVVIFNVDKIVNHIEFDDNTSVIYFKEDLIDIFNSRFQNEEKEFLYCLNGIEQKGDGSLIINKIEPTTILQRDNISILSLDCSRNVKIHSHPNSYPDFRYCALSDDDKRSFFISNVKYSCVICGIDKIACFNKKFEPVDVIFPARKTTVEAKKIEPIKSYCNIKLDDISYGGDKLVIFSKDIEKSYLISGQSMLPLIKQDDLLILQKYNKSEELHIGEIIMFDKGQDGFDYENESLNYIHRIMDIDNETIKTKGINNQYYDFPIKKDKVLFRLCGIIYS